MRDGPSPYPSGETAVLVTWEIAGKFAYHCTDGRMTIKDVARAGRVPLKVAKRAIDTYLDESTASGLSAFDDTLPHPSTVTRAEMARIVAQQLGVGWFGLTKRIDERRAAQPPAPPKEQRVKPLTHPYRRGDKGRSVRSQPGGSQLARLTCGCGKSHDVRFRELCASEQMDKKFIQAGWRIDPAVCPTCQPKKQEITVKPTPAAIKSQVLLFQLLTAHFDPEQGAYQPGHSDETIAKATSMSVETVKAVRIEGFGDIREPAELTALANDLDALTRLATETMASLQTEMDSMRSRIADLRRKFAA